MKYLFILFLILPTILTGCGNRSNIDNANVAPTEEELDARRFKSINDSISDLDTIKVMGSLFMGMTSKEYASIASNCNDYYKNGIIIGSLKFNILDTAMYHNKVHTVIIKASNYETENDESWINVDRKNSEKSFREVITSLTKKYGKPSWVIEMSPMGEYRGFQRGVANWHFDKLDINYEQKQWTYQRGQYLYEHHVEGYLSYDIPRIPTTEEKNKADSIANEVERRRNAEIQRNDSLKSLL